MAKTKWKAHEGCFRAAGKGAHGEHHGTPVWDEKAAEKRRKSLENFVFSSWVEAYIDGVWKRVGPVHNTPESV
jgi:hypothetical protein